MSVEKETVTKIASLARIAMSDAEAEALVPEFNAILQWVEQLGEVDTANVPAMASVIPGAMQLRDDAINDGDCRDDVLANAPVAEHGFFAVPKVIE